MSYREKIYIFRKAMKRGLCRLSNFENRTTTGRAIAILMTEINIEKRYGAVVTSAVGGEVDFQTQCPTDL